MYRLPLSGWPVGAARQQEVDPAEGGENKPRSQDRVEGRETDLQGEGAGCRRGRGGPESGEVGLDEGLVLTRRFHNRANHDGRAAEPISGLADGAPVPGFEAGDDFFHRDDGVVKVFLPGNFIADLLQRAVGGEGCEEGRVEVSGELQFGRCGSRSG